MNRLNRFLSAAALVAAAIPLLSSPVVAQSPEEEVWGMEESYWELVQAHDVEAYVRLWHEDFIGWPCGDPEPLGVGNIGDWVRDLRAANVAFTYELRREAVRSIEGAVVAHYAVRWAFEYPDGRIEGNETWRKITHTWVEADGRWQIAGGMCADLEAQ